MYRLNVKYTKLWHHVFAKIGLPALQNTLALSATAAVARYHNGKAALCLRQHFGIVQHALTVTAVGTAGQQ